MRRDLAQALADTAMDRDYWQRQYYSAFRYARIFAWIDVALSLALGAVALFRA